MDHQSKPLIRNYILVVVGALVVMAVTLFGILNNPGEIIKQDVLMGPIIATGRIVIPLVIVIGVLYWFASIKQCKACGKIFFWRKDPKH